MIDVQQEIVVDPNGVARHAGSDVQEGEFVDTVRLKAERSLYFFVKAILGRSYLNAKLHGGLAVTLTTSPPYRKQVLLPREHCKTTLVNHGIPAHAIIQPKDHNIYVPGRAGVDSRILIAGETLDRASKGLGVLQTGIFENNKLFRALWPHCIWEEKPSKRWNANEMVVPRNVDYPDPTVQALGVGGAVAGARYDIVIKDDLISLNAANSPAEMSSAINWHRASRALFESDQTLEYIIGTRWAVFDLYSFIAEGGLLDGEYFDPDYTVHAVTRSMIEDGVAIYPEKFSLLPTPGKQDVEMLKKQFGLLFYLNYMNSAANPELTDFSIEDMRFFNIENDFVVFDDTDKAFGSDVVEASKPVDFEDEHVKQREMDDGVRGKRMGEVLDIVQMRKEHLGPLSWRR